MFNTDMSGYVESLTDPSYTGQILIDCDIGRGIHSQKNCF